MPGLGFVFSNNIDKHLLIEGHIVPNTSDQRSAHTERQVLRTLVMQDSYEDKTALVRHANKDCTKENFYKCTNKYLSSFQDFELYPQGVYYIYTVGFACQLPHNSNGNKPCVKLYSNLGKKYKRAKLHIFSQIPQFPDEAFRTDLAKKQLARFFKNLPKDKVLEIFDAKNLSKQNSDDLEEYDNLMKEIPLFKGLSLKTLQTLKNKLENLRPEEMYSYDKYCKKEFGKDTGYKKNASKLISYLEYLNKKDVLMNFISSRDFLKYYPLPDFIRNYTNRDQAPASAIKCLNRWIRRTDKLIPENILKRLEKLLQNMYGLKNVVYHIIRNNKI